jgi:hypothetical protein
METQEARNYNLEFCEALLKHPRVENPQLFDLLSVAEELIGEKILLVEEAIWEVVNIPEVQVSDEEWEHLKKLIAALRKSTQQKYWQQLKEYLGHFNPSADEDEIQSVISNAIKTSNIKMKKLIKDEGTAKEESESEGQMKGADVFLYENPRKFKQIRKENQHDSHRFF